MGNAGKAAGQAAGKVKKVGGFKRKQDEEDLASCFPSMSYTTRLKSFGITFGLGVVLSLIGLFWFWTTMFLPLPSVKAFAIFYSLGNLCMLASGFFLVGLKRQIRLIMAYGRWVCLLIYVGIMGFTLWYILFNTREVEDSNDSNEMKDIPDVSIWIVIPLLILQFLAGIWYMLSYIPYGRALAKKCCMRCATAE